jgi:hypothetical protein
MKEIFVLTHEYSDKSRFQICGATEDLIVVYTWLAGGESNHAYRIPVDQMKSVHPQSDGWPEFKPQ